MFCITLCVCVCQGYEGYDECWAVIPNLCTQSSIRKLFYVCTTNYAKRGVFFPPSSQSKELYMALIL